MLFWRLPWRNRKKLCRPYNHRHRFVVKKKENVVPTARTMPTCTDGQFNTEGHPLRRSPEPPAPTALIFGRRHIWWPSAHLCSPVVVVNIYGAELDKSSTSRLQQTRLSRRIQDQWEGSIMRSNSRGTRSHLDADHNHERSLWQEWHWGAHARLSSRKWAQPKRTTMVQSRVSPWCSECNPMNRVESLGDVKLYEERRKFDFIQMG
jgi:hypothetical protein